MKRWNMTHHPKSKREHSPPDVRPNMSDLRIVLLGKSIKENRRVVNLILNKEAFERKAPPSGVEEFSERVEGRNITVISTSQLLNPELKLQAIIQKASALSSPEPHVIILVLQHRDFSEKQRDRLLSVLNCFGEQAMKRTLILTTDDEPGHAGLRSAQEIELIQEISTECGGGHLQLHNTQHSLFIKKVDEMISEQQNSSLDSRAADSDDRQLVKQEGHDLRKGESASQEYDKRALRIVLLGKNISENSRVRNSILGIDVDESVQSIYLKQHNVLKISGMVNDRHVAVINTLHLLNPDTTDHQISQTVRECVEMSDPGPHAFILTLQYEDFTEDDMTRVKHVLNTFSEDAINHTIIIIMTDKETHHSHMNTAISQLTKVCRGRHLLLDEGKPDWPAEIFNRVDMMLKDTKDYYVTCEVYEDAKEVSEEEEQRRSLRSSRSEVNKHLSYYDDDGKSQQSKRSEGTLVDLRGLFRTSLPKSSGKQKLNLVLCGSDGSLKVSVSKLLRGKPIATSHQKSSSEEVFKKEEKVHGRQISLLELPALRCLSEDEVMHQTLNCVSLSDPGVHAFLLIIPVGSLTDGDKLEVKKVLNMFDTKQHVIVIFISDGTITSPVRDFINSSPECQKLIRGCGGLYCVMGLKEPASSRQIPELLKLIEKMKTNPYSPEMYVKAQANRGRHEAEEIYKEELKRLENKIKELQEKGQTEGADCTEDLQCLRIVLIGRTGSGKSATGNTILGREEFLVQASIDSVTTVCEKRVGEVDGRSVAVVDTPGLFDTALTNDQVVEEIVKCVSLSAPGPHVFVIVLSVGRFIQVESDTIDLIKKIFGLKSAQFSIVLFTKGDDLKGQTIEDYVKRSKSAELKKLIRDCGNRLLAFNNNENQDKTQVMKLLKMIEEVKSNNQGGYFTNDMFEEAEMSIKKKMEEIMKEREREIQKQREELQDKYEMEMKDMMKRLEEEKERAQEERRKMENQLKLKEEKLRKEFEEKEKTDQKQREIENQKRLEEEKQQRAEYDQRIEEIKRAIDNQRSQYEQQQKEREEEDRKREEKHRQDQDKMKSEQERIIAEEQRKQEEEIKKKDLEKKRRNEEEEKERQRWKRRIKEAENDRKDTQEEIKRQQREWEDEIKRRLGEREEEERKRKEKHEEQLREKQEELEKMRKRFEGEREEERQKMEEERQKQRREREEKEREYEEKRQETKRLYEQLERERKEEWEREKQEDEEKREEERKRWKKMIEDLKQEQEEEIMRKEAKEKERQKREEKERDEMKQKHEEEIKQIKKKHEEEARKQAEESNDFRERKEQHIQELQQMLEDHQKQQELLEKLYQHLKDEKSEEVKELKAEIEDLKKKWCRLM